MMLTLKRLVNGINNAAADCGELTIKIKPVFDKNGNPSTIKWMFFNNKFQEEDITIKDYFAGIKIDGASYPIRLYDINNKNIPRFITDRTTTMQSNLPKHQRVGQSAFKRMINIIKIAYNHIDDKVINVLLDTPYMKANVGINYPLLVEIPEEIQSQEELAEYFNSATYFSKKNRFWKKILVLNNRRFFICNHIFHPSIAKFRQLMSKLTGLDIEPDEIELKENQYIADTTENVDKSVTEDITEDNLVNIDDEEEVQIKSVNNQSKVNHNIEDLIKSSFGFKM